jgi:hypothetical protein
MKLFSYGTFLVAGSVAVLNNIMHAAATTSACVPSTEVRELFISLVEDIKPNQADVVASSIDTLADTYPDLVKSENSNGEGVADIIVRNNPSAGFTQPEKDLVARIVHAGLPMSMSHAVSLSVLLRSENSTLSEEWLLRNILSKRTPTKEEMLDAMQTAIYLKATGLVQFLLESGVDPLSKSALTDRPFNIARQVGFKPVLTMLYKAAVEKALNGTQAKPCKHRLV